MKLSVSLQLLDVGQRVGLLGTVISSSQYGAVGGMKIGKENQNSREKNFPKSHFDHHKSHMT
jgi:hypothetical protein